MSLNNWYNKGMDPDEYIESMEVNKEGLLHIYDNFSLPADESFFEEIKNKNLRAIVLTEDWCGDAMLNLPILLKISEAANMPVRALLRDDNLELMDQYLTNGTARSIPIIIFIDIEGNEVAKWGPRAASIQAYIDEARAKLPPKDTSDFEEKQKQMHLFISKSYRDNQDNWYTVYESLKETLKAI
ncbi:thioredoxin family protein [Oceanobacillus sp. J11TS1]|uniref:thioredoxin family protein n=1 Tax=Oceanobacillus sp. J11TS1 TaxID=2807191 RepID=UPI001B155C32|nr:thioredoxin family protein [Oceanobacillus sp. J11TS1]GIO24932.1 thioredoxin [Oceanobacillus sp. J11TS1]